MFTAMHLASNRPVEGEDVDADWYINKIAKSMTVKASHSVNGVCRIRLMEDILGGLHAPNTTLPIFKGPTYGGDCAGAYATKLDCDNTTDHYSARTTGLAEGDEDDEFGKMTLKEMTCLLRRKARKSSKKPSSAVSSSVPPPEAGSTLVNKVFPSETLPSIDCSVQLGVLELHLDSSTSNSAESGDEVSPRGVATSCHKPIDIMAVKNEILVDEDYGSELSTKKRKSIVGPLVSESAISLEDDECTLQMWQAYRRRLHGGKRSRGCTVEQNCGMSKQPQSEASLAPVFSLGVCSINSISDIKDLGRPFLSSAVLPPEGILLENHGSGSGALSCQVQEEMKENSSLKTAPDATLVEHALDDEPDCEVKRQERISTCREDKESQEPSLGGGSPQKLDTRSIPLSVKGHPWTLRPCKGIDVPTSGSSKNDNTHRIRLEPNTTCEIAQGSGESAMPAGQSPSMEEPCTNICSQPKNDATGIESTVPYLQVIDTATCFSEPVGNQILSISQKMSAKESFPFHRSEDSPSFMELEAGLDCEKKSSQNVGPACHQSGEELPGSPLSLFSTERLDAEEEQELEQLKPSKIPCKRKAISPLSRERLLQASKCGERERPFFDVDKRGFKKLPRAFKGFIGRDTSYHESINAGTKLRNTVIMESSPPEKLLQKEEVLPGSPCHNRKKFLSAKPLSLNDSLPCSFRDPVTIIRPVSSVQGSLPSPACAQRLSLVLNSSPSPPSQQNSKPINGKSPTSLSPSIPTKGILRSSPPSCQGACNCEECASLRCRAERAAEFSQRQMHDIEGLAVRLLKELNMMRCVVEDNLIQRTAPKVDSPRSAFNSEQIRKAANNALETEKMAKAWLVRMARDCNRYCKIMRMQERKLTFADESGGQLCHVKLFHSQPKPQQDGTLVSAVKENIATSSWSKGGSCDSEPEIEKASE